MRLCNVCVYNINGKCGNPNSKYYGKDTDDIPEDYCPFF